MAHGLNSLLKKSVATVGCAKTEGKTGIGSRRIFAPHFKLQVLDSYRNDADCKGNQRATARKYGIHRRQIQKWLQVENTLRNSVGKGKSECVEPINQDGCGNVVALSCSRPRDDIPAVGVSEPRVPCFSPESNPWPTPPAPLDFTTHSRDYTSPSVARPASPPAPADPASPIDLSLKKSTAGISSSSAPATFAPLPPPPLPPLLLRIAPSSSSPPSLAQPHPDLDVWDLSTKNLKRKHESDSPMPHQTTATSSVLTGPSSPKPIKLFKPYLDVIKDDDDNSAPIKIEPPALAPQITPPPCCSSLTVFTNCDSYYYNNNNNNINNNNNNNNVCEVKNEYGGTYTITELQSKNYYYPLHNGNVVYHELSGFCSDESCYMQGVVAPLKQRQSYSLDFKLSAIDCYYQDSVCKGNQRAVATKYNIHRRQVQKWLKQAEELRLRNESSKQMHAVR